MKCIILFVLIVFGRWSCTLTDCPSPGRPEGLPAGAFWVGGCDGGYWIEKVQLEKTATNVQITLKGYLDYSGAYDWTTIFCCEDTLWMEHYPLWYEALEKELNYVDVGQLLWMNTSNNQYCSCEPCSKK